MLYGKMPVQQASGCSRSARCRQKEGTVEDIREQFPLELNRTLALADQLGFRHPKDRRTHMTTDLLVTRTSGLLEAYSIKTDRHVLDDARTREKLYLEKLYWETQGIPFHLCLKEDVNRYYVQNIMDVVYCYDQSRVQDAHGMIRHLIAHKKIAVDMGTSLLDYHTLINQYKMLLPPHLQSPYTPTHE